MGVNHDVGRLDVTMQEAYGMIASGEIRDAKTILLLQHAMLSR